MMQNEFQNAKSQRRLELLCAVLLGFGQLCIMTGFDSESFILESVIHSIHERAPGVISSYAGYYGQAVTYLAYMISCLISPSFLAVTTPKINLVLAAIFFTAFPLGFLFTNSYYYYFSAVLLGIGFSLFYQGQGGYLTSHSTRSTIESNVSLSWSLGCCCMLVGSGILALITLISVKQNQNPINLDNGMEIAHTFERKFSDLEIRLLFSAFTGISILGIITYFFLPSKDVENCIESSEKKESFTEAFRQTMLTLISPKMVQLCPLFVLCGLNTSFWLSIFPTSMTFTMHNSNLIYLPAVYSLGAGSGEVFMGVSISFLSKRIKNFGQKPTMLVGAITVLIYCTLVHFSTAADAPIRPTHEEPILFYHSYHLALLIGFIAGMSDCCINSVRSVICALAMPKRRAQAFSVSKVYQALASCILFFLSPITPLYVYTIGLPILALLALVLFCKIADRTKTMERKLTMETMQSKNNVIKF